MYIYECDPIFEDFAVRVNKNDQSINEGKLKDKLYNFNNKSGNKYVRRFIANDDYQSAKRYLDAYKMYFSKEEYDALEKEINNMKSKPQERDDSKTLNSIEKNFLNSAFNFINSEYNKLKNDYKYKDEKELQKYLSIHKEKNKIIYNDSLNIAYVGIDEKLKIDEDENQDLFGMVEDFTSDLEAIVNKKYKDAVEYYFNEGRGTVFYVDRENIPGNK